MTDAEWTQWSLKFFGPPFALLAFFVVGLVRKWWVLGWTYAELQTECLARQVKADAEVEEWKEMALRSVGLAETTVGIKQRSA